MDKAIQYLLTEAAETVGNVAERKAQDLGKRVLQTLKDFYFLQTITLISGALLSMGVFGLVVFGTLYFFWEGGPSVGLRILVGTCFFLTLIAGGGLIYFSNDQRVRSLFSRAKSSINPKSRPSPPEELDFDLDPHADRLSILEAKTDLLYKKLQILLNAVIAMEEKQKTVGPQPIRMSK